MCLHVRRCVWCVGNLTRLKRVGSFRVDARVLRRERVWRSNVRRCGRAGLRIFIEVETFISRAWICLAVEQVVIWVTSCRKILRRFFDFLRSASVDTLLSALPSQGPQCFPGDFLYRSVILVKEERHGRCRNLVRP